MSNEEQLKVNSIELANEFLKLCRGFKLESEREDHLPEEIQTHIANEHLNEIMAKHELDPEYLIWGMLTVIEILTRLAEVTPEELSEMLDTFIDYKKGKENG
jgi:hypothetical protein